MTTHQEYSALPAVNWSSLHLLAASPLLYRWRADHPEAERSQSLIFGAAVHCVILEPEKFGARYALFDGTRRGKEWDRWQVENAGRESLKPDEMARIEACVNAVQSHRAASELLRGGRAEEVVQWTDEATGLACKGRLDYLRPDGVIDLKTSRDVSPAKFGRDAANFGYLGQLAFYHDGSVASKVSTGTLPPHIIAVQSDAPYDVAVYYLDDAALDIGRSMYRTLLRKLIECEAASYWPGVCPEPMPLLLPKWAEQTEDESEAF